MRQLDGTSSDTAVVRRSEGGTPWFMCPLRPEYHPGGAGERQVRWVRHDDELSAEIHVHTPRWGGWTVQIKNVDWPAPDILPGDVYHSCELAALPAGISSLERLSFLLAEGQIIVTGVTVDLGGNIVAIAPEGVTCRVISDLGDETFHAKEVSFRP